VEAVHQAAEYSAVEGSTGIPVAVALGPIRGREEMLVQAVGSSCRAKVQNGSNSELETIHGYQSITDWSFLYWTTYEDMLSTNPR
jgi:hypothetical protein